MAGTGGAQDTEGAAGGGIAGQGKGRPSGSKADASEGLEEVSSCPAGWKTATVTAPMDWDAPRCGIDSRCC